MMLLGLQWKCWRTVGMFVTVGFTPILKRFQTIEEDCTQHSSLTLFPVIRRPQKKRVVCHTFQPSTDKEIQARWLYLFFMDGLEKLTDRHKDRNWRWITDMVCKTKYAASSDKTHTHTHTHTPALRPTSSVKITSLVTTLMFPPDNRWHAMTKHEPLTPPSGQKQKEKQHLQLKAMCMFYTTDRHLFVV